MNITDREWTEEEIRILRERWDRKESAGKIGLVLNRSRSSVLGKAHRLDLTGRPSPIKPRTDSKPTTARARGKLKNTLPPLGSLS